MLWAVTGKLVRVVGWINGVKCREILEENGKNYGIALEIDRLELFYKDNYQSGVQTCLMST